MESSQTELVDSLQMQAVLNPIFYGDIFDYPLTFDEIYRFIEVEASPAQVQKILDQAVRQGHLLTVNGYYSLPGKEHLAAHRRRRGQAAQFLWPVAERYGRLLAALPFVRFVAVTGALAVDNPRHAADDIDFLIVTRPNRLWLCRAMVIVLVRLARRRGVTLCPNYLITENVLEFDDMNLFAAREMAQMTPLYGLRLYDRLWAANGWVIDMLPHSRKSVDRLADRLSPTLAVIKKTGELLLAGPWGHWLECILQQKQIGKHTRQAQTRQAADTLLFTPDVCKGHYDSHGQKTLAAYRARQTQFGLNGRGGQTVNSEQ
jgi:hypothetical protein